jgi:opine dehydrogenase
MFEPARSAVTVVGGGHGAFAVATDLGARGFEVRLFEDEAFGRSLDVVAASGGIAIESGDPLHHARAIAPIALATYDAGEAVRGAKVVIFVVPAYAERRFSDLLRSSLTEDQLVLFACGNLGGALEFWRERGAPLSGAVVAECEALIVSGFKTGPDRVRFSGRKLGVRVGVMPAAAKATALPRVQELYPDVTSAPDVIATGLGNVNPVLHPPLMILNAGRVGPKSGSIRMYRGGMTRPIAAVMDALDRERLDVAARLHADAFSALQRLCDWYPDIERSDGLYEAIRTNPAYREVRLPTSLDHRFLTEDVAYGLVPLEAIAREIGVRTPTTTALVDVTSALLGREMREGGRVAGHMGLTGMSAAGIERFLAAGQGTVAVTHPTGDARQLTQEDNDGHEFK